MNSSDTDDVINKRHVLKIISSVYDPLCVLSLVVINLKLLFQEFCFNKLSWDEELNTSFLNKWNKLIGTLRNFESVRIPRYYLRSADCNDITDIEMHGFADASKFAYAAVVYLKFISPNGTYTSFIASKTRVAPLNEKSIPRLELLACLILSRLMNVIKQSLTNITLNRIYCHTDSMDCVYWVNNSNKVWDRFVQNRVNEIRKNLPGIKWKHCPGKVNPADIPSRGINITDPKNRKIWLHGPDFLLNSVDDVELVDDLSVESDPVISPAVEKISAFVQNESESKPLISSLVNVERSSTINRLLSITSYVLRFIFNCRNTIKRRGEFTIDELNEARDLWIKDEQHELLKNIDYLKKIKVSLGVYMDENGFLRVKGRMEHSSMKGKTPILLRTSSYFTDLIIKEAHENVLHYGTKDTLNEVRTLYWIPAGRSRVRKMIFRCKLCRKNNCKPFQKVPVAPLPDFRVNLSFPFNNCGVDYLGPLFVYPSPGKQKDLRCKVHVVLFTCAATRAVHLDLVSDAGSFAFTNCLKRFISRRGTPKLFISDNAKCFLGPEVKKFLSKKKCSWEFILEKAAWWGGFWERLVQTVKIALRKILGKSILSYEELLTVITEIEGVINSRPLCYQYSDEIEEVITPSHLMHGRRLNSVPESFNLEEESDVPLKGRLLHLQTLLSHFRARWSHEYLSELREYHRCDKLTPAKEIKVGDVVLIENKKLPRSRWKLGLVEELMQSKDHRIRGCKLKTWNENTGHEYINRPVNQLCHFEVNSGEDQTKTNPPPVKISDVNEHNQKTIRIRRNAAILGELKRKFK